MELEPSPANFSVLNNMTTKQAYAAAEKIIYQGNIIFFISFFWFFF